MIVQSTDGLQSYIRVVEIEAFVRNVDFLVIFVNFDAMKSAGVFLLLRVSRACERSGMFLFLTETQLVLPENELWYR